ncbi:MAG: hypothetical protein ACJAU1_000777 [Psychromonas sp.]|jgi:hypothetical protein
MKHKKATQMNIKKRKIGLALGGVLFLSVPLSSAFADQKHNEIKQTQRGGPMQYIKSELRGYVQGVKSNDAQKMQQHLNELLTLTAMTAEQAPVEIKKMPAAGMNHEKMGMSEMEHANMDSKEIAAIDSSNMANDDMKMNGADHDMSAMPGMDHSNMDNADMKMNGADHDMSTMPSMEGMSAAQHHQHIIYMQSIAGLNDLFKQLDKTQDKTEIKLILGEIKEQLKKHQQLIS